MIGILLVIFGIAGILGAIFAKEFWVVDGLGLHEFKSRQKPPAWLGRLVFAVVGTALIAGGIKLMMDGR